MDNNSLLPKYLFLNKIIKDGGGRIAIEGDAKLEKIYDELLELENRILKQFGLQILMKYREVLFELTQKNNPESNCEEIIYFLHDSEVSIINSAQEQHIELILLLDFKN